MRSTASAVNGVAGGIAAVAGGMIGSVFFALYLPLPFWLAAALTIVSIFLVYCFLRDSESGEKNVQLVTASQNAPGFTGVLSARQTRSILFLSISMFSTFCAFGIFQTFLTSYTVGSLGMSSSISAMLFSVGAASFMLMAFPASHLAIRLKSRKAVQAIGLVLFAGSALGIFWMANQINIWFFVVAIGTGLALAMVSQEAMMVDSAPTGSRIGTFASLVQITRYLAYIFSPAMGGWLVERLGNDYNLIWLIAAIMLLVAFITSMGISTGEAK